MLMSKIDARNYLIFITRNQCDNMPQAQYQYELQGRWG